MLAPWYVTRNQVKAVLDVAETARANAQIDRACESASRSVEELCHRRFYPWTGGRTFDWPNPQRAAPWRLWLDDKELISLTSLTTGGQAITGALLRPDTGPPFRYLELDRSTTGGFGGSSTPQRDIVITGVWGYRLDTSPAGTLTGSVNASLTTWPVSDGTIGVGDLLTCESERVIVTGQAMADTGVTTSSTLAASTAVTSVPVSSGAGFTYGETLLIDSERMLVLDVAANTITVKRAWDGSVLSAHTSPTAVWALRSLTLVRGALGTTAGAHNSGTALSVQLYPGPCSELAEAYALTRLQTARSGYTKTAGGGGRPLVGSADLVDLEQRVYRSAGRKARIRAV